MNMFFIIKKMINKIFDYFKGSSKGESLADSLSEVNLKGNLFKKQIGKKKEEISEEANLYLSVVNEKTHDFNLNIENSDYEYKNSKLKLKLDWNNLLLPISSDLGVKLCTENGREVLIFERQKVFYLLYVFVDELENLNRFVKTLSTLICSYDYEIPVNECKEEDAEGFVMNLADVEDIDAFLEENYSKIYQPDSDNLIKLPSVDNLANDFNAKTNLKDQVFKQAYPNASSLFSADGELYQYDRQADDIKLITHDSIFHIYKTDAFRYFISIDHKDGEKTYTSTLISQESNVITNREENLIMWLAKDENGSVNAFNFVFYEKGIIDKLKPLITKSHYEAGAQTKYEELKDDEREWLEQANDDDHEDTEDIEMILDNFQEAESENPNKATAQAYLHDRTFVVREDNGIGVYKTDEDDILSVKSLLI
jgi:hypothetical protein